MLQSPSQIAARSGSNAPPTRRTCRVCGRADEHAEHIVREMQFGTREKFAYFQCRGCHCLQIVSIPADLARYYPADYYSTQPLDERKYQGFRGAMRLLPYRANVFPDRPLRWMISRLHRSNHFVPLRELGIHRATRVLDVGCGNGKAFAYPLKAIGFASVTGCDPFIAQELRYENGLVIHRATLNEMESKGRWELITFHHAFEHLPDPVETIATVARLLQPSGHCLIRIPTCSSYSWDNYGVHWVQLDAPRHLFLHSTESMRRLAERAGLELVSIRSDSTYFQFWGSENYRQDIPLIQQRKGSGISRLGWAWKKQRWQRRAAALNRDTRGDQAAFILRKPAT